LISLSWFVTLQFAQEGYNVVHLVYPFKTFDRFMEDIKTADQDILDLGADWVLISYGLSSGDADGLVSHFALSATRLKACVHFCPSSETSKGFLFKDNEGKHVP
jgi:hypothetical protein